MNAIMIVADGMADRPHPKLKGLTPLEVAETPNMDRVAIEGVCGIHDPISPGVPPGSDVANLALLGYEALEVYSGRGAFEALGAGIELNPGDVAFRCNFATVNENLVVLDRRAGRISTKEAEKLAEALKNLKLESYPEVEVEFVNTVEHRAVLVLRGEKLSNKISDTDPGKTGLKVMECKPLENSFEAKRTAEIVNVIMRKFYNILKEHPVNLERKKAGFPIANIVLLRGAGIRPEIETLKEKYGIKAVAVCAVPLVKGVCIAVGMKTLEVPGATGGYDTNLRAKAEAALKALEESDFVYLHVKATDLASHDKNPEKKIEVIERVDEMLGLILDRINLDKTYLVLTADHTTASITGEHEGDPVPVVITGLGVRKDDVRKFTERECAKGGIGRIRAKHIMPTVMNLIGKMKKLGA